MYITDITICYAEVAKVTKGLGRLLIKLSCAIMTVILGYLILTFRRDVPPYFESCEV